MRPNHGRNPRWILPYGRPIAGKLCRNRESRKPSRPSPEENQKGGFKGQTKTTEVSSFQKQSQEMQEQLKKLKIEKGQTADILKQMEEELESRDREQEKLIDVILRVFTQRSRTRTTKKSSPPYVLWCKDQWVEVKKANQEADFKEMSNMLGSNWKPISAEENKPYSRYFRLMLNAKRLKKHKIDPNTTSYFVLNIYCTGR